MPTPVDELAHPPWPYDLGDSRPTPDLSLLPPEEAERTRARLAELDHACGCAHGAAAALVTLAAYIAVLAVGPGLLAGSWWVTIGVGAAVFILAAGGGKTLGQARARQQRDRLIDELHWRVATLDPKSVEN